MVLDDIGANAIKIGMLHNIKTIKCVYKILKKYKLKNIEETEAAKAALLAPKTSEKSLLHIPR